MDEPIKYFAVSLKKSPAGQHSTHKATLLGLGLKRLGKTVVRKGIPSVRGMLYKVSHLVRITQVDGPNESARQRKLRLAKKA